MVQYTLVKGREGFLGRGQFGVVEKVLKKSSWQAFACKTIRFQDSDKHREPAEREYSILSCLDHHNVVKYVDIIWDSTSARIYMEYCGGGSLADFISSKRLSHSQQRTPTNYILSVFHQLSAALLYCHNGLTVGVGGVITGNSFDWNPVLHRDIKPGNIMLSTREETDEVIVKLGDFGLSTFLEDDQAPSSYAGTKEYLAPEINRYRAGKIHWTKACDIFSVGCTIYELTSLKPPFVGHMDDDDSIEPLPDHVVPKIRNRVMTCMSSQPERRPDAFDVLRSIKWQKAGLGPSGSRIPRLACSAHRTPSAPPSKFRDSYSSSSVGIRNSRSTSAVGSTMSVSGFSATQQSVLTDAIDHMPRANKEMHPSKESTSDYKHVSSTSNSVTEDLHIVVKVLAGKTFNLHLVGPSLVSDIMEAIQQAQGFLINDQILIFGREQLRPQRTISSLQIRGSSRLHLDLRLRGNSSTSTVTDMDQYRIFIRTFDRRTILVDSDPSWRIVELKDAIEMQESIPFHQQCLIFAEKGLVLHDWETLSAYEFSSGTTLHLSLYLAITDGFLVYVKTFQKVIPIVINPDWIVACVMSAIQDKEGTPMDQQVLYYGQKKLDAEKPLWTYRIYKESFIWLFNRKESMEKAMSVISEDGESEGDRGYDYRDS